MHPETEILLHMEDYAPGIYYLKLPHYKGNSTVKKPVKL
jgi:hypothetical protein